MQSVSAYSRCIHLIPMMYMYTSRRAADGVCLRTKCRWRRWGGGHGSGSNARLLLISRFVTCRLHIIIIMYYAGENKKYTYYIMIYTRCWCVTRRSHVFAGGAKSRRCERRNRKSPGQRSQPLCGARKENEEEDDDDDCTCVIL